MFRFTSVRFMTGLSLVSAVVLAGCGSSSEPASSASSALDLSKLDPSKIVDLSYAYDDSTIYWPTEAGFQHKKIGWDSKSGFWLAMGEFSSAEHGGTHLDAPIHFAEGKWTVAQIPTERLVSPALVIDVRADAARDTDYRVLPADISRFETENGPIASGSLVIIRTGWGKRWPDKKAYLGSDTPGDDQHLHFPGISREAAEILVMRGVRAVAIDTASLDHGPSKDFIAHQTLMRASIYGIENLANADRLPSKGATIFALPMKIGQGTGAPVRVVALLP